MPDSRVKLRIVIEGTWADLATAQADVERLEREFPQPSWRVVAIAPEPLRLDSAGRLQAEALAVRVAAEAERQTALDLLAASAADLADPAVVEALAAEKAKREAAEAAPIAAAAEEPKP